jgi:hypothetical protein
MGCRCSERSAAIREGARAIARGDLKAASQQAAFVTKTFTQDARSGDLSREMARRLARMRMLRR